jgi:hypothetical protein
MSFLIQQAIFSIMVDDYHELWEIESNVKEYNWLCSITKQTFLDLLNDIHQRPEEEAVYFVSALRLLRDQHKEYELSCMYAEKMLRNRLRFSTDYHTHIGSLYYLPKEILFTISTKLL